MNFEYSHACAKEPRTILDHMLYEAFADGLHSLFRDGEGPYNAADRYILSVPYREAKSAAKHTSMIHVQWQV